MKKNIFLSLGLSVLLLLATIIPAFAQTDNSSSTVDTYKVLGSVTQVSEDSAKSFNGHWSSLSLNLNLSKIKYFTVKGEKGANGEYSYKFSLQKGPDNHNTIVATVKAVDDTTHTQLIQVGESSTPPSLPNNGGTATSSISKIKSPYNKNTTNDPTHSFTTEWFDPLGIPVNYVTDYITYTPSLATYFSKPLCAKASKVPSRIM